jgi:hypothetical protein
MQREELMQGPWPRRGLIAAAVVAVYAAVGFLLAPWLIERTLVGTLDERLSLDTRIENLSLNPFALSLAVDGLAVTDPTGERLLAFERLYVNFQLASLFRWAWSFDEIHLIRPVFTFDRINETQTNLSVLGDKWAATAEAPAEDPEPAQPGENPIPRLRIADLRIVEGHVTVIDQTQTEPFSTDLSPIDLEVAELSTLPDQSGRQQVTVRTESGARVTWTGSLSVNPVSLSGDMELEGTYTPVLFRYFRDQLALPLSFDGGEIIARVDYLVEMDPEGQLQVQLENLSSSLTGLVVNQPDHPPLASIGEMSLSGGRFAWPEKIVHLDRIEFADVNVQAFQRADGGYLPLPPEASAQAPDTETAPAVAEEGAPEAEADPWQITVSTLALSRWQLVHTDTGLEDGRLALTDFALTLNDFSIEDAQRMPLSITAALDPGGTLALDGNLQLFPEIRLEGSVSATELALAAAQPYLNSVANIGIMSGTVTLSGQVTAGDDPAFEYRGDFHVDALSLNDRARKEPLFSWDRLSVDKLVATPAALELSLLSIDGPYARVQIEQDGSTNIGRTLIEEPATTAEASTEASVEAQVDAQATSPFDVIVGETRIANGSAHFTDLALPLRFEAQISDIKGELSTVATSSREPARVDLNGQVNEYGQLNIDGHISAFAPDQNTDITVDFDNVELPRMSPYTIKFAGRAIAEGRTDLTLVYRLNEGALDGSNRLVIRDLTLGEKVEQPGAMDLPLDMAVALLKDSEGKVDFSFPVTGTLDDPSFSYSGAVMKALSNVIGGIVAAPFRLLGSLVGMAPDELEHIGFEPGTGSITPPQRETLAKLTEALTQRPQLILQVAPVINPEADTRAMAATLVDDAVAGRIAEHPEPDLSRVEQQRQVLEALYDEAGLLPERASVADTHRTATETGETRLDVPAYSADLREALIAAREISDLDLEALAMERIEAIRSTLITVAGLDEGRVETLPTEAVKLNEDGLVQMSLNVSIAD